MRAYRLVACFTLLLAGTALASVGATVDQKNFAFSVDTVTVHKGDSIVFTNSDRTPHNILIKSGGMLQNSGVQKPGEDVSVLFDKAGAFDVMCGIHPKMKMTVVVE